MTSAHYPPTLSLGQPLGSQERIKRVEGVGRGIGIKQLAKGSL